MHKLNRNKIKPIPITNKEYLEFKKLFVCVDQITIGQIRKLRQVSKKEGLKDLLSEDMYERLNIDEASSFELDHVAFLVWSRCIHEIC